MSKRQTPREKMLAFYRAANDNYDTWGHWIVEAESPAEIVEKFESGEYANVRAAIKQAKEFADHANEIQATAW